MAELKTKVEPIDPYEFINKIDDVSRREDALVLIKMFEEITEHPAKMWGPSIIGFDSYDYTYESGHSGTMCKTGFSPRKAAHTLYLLLGFGDYEPELSKLGKHTTGKGCLYIKKLKDVNMDILRDLIAKSYKAMCIKYP